MTSTHSVIGIHYIPSDGFQWANFLQQKLNEDGYNIKSTLLDLTKSNSSMHETNILLVSPDFFNLKSLTTLLKINPQRALMVLLGTEALDVRTMLIDHKCKEMVKYITFFETSATELSVRSLLIGIIQLYEHVHERGEDEHDQIPHDKHDQDLHHKHLTDQELHQKHLHNQHSNDQDEYDLLPPPKPALRVSEDNRKSANIIQNVAISCGESKKEAYLLCTRKGNDEIQIELQDTQGHIKAIYENKVVYRFEIDKSVPSGKLHFLAKDGDLILGTGIIDIPGGQKTKQSETTSSKLDILKSLLGEEEDPICLMCKALKLPQTSREALDENLAKKCKCLEPLRRHEGVFLSSDRSNKGHRNETWPTLIHFAAEYNLPKFCEELLKLPFSADETHVMNKDNETPLDVAKRKECLGVAKILEHFAQKATKHGNVPGNKDSGVVEDDISRPGSMPEPTTPEYTDMSKEFPLRDSASSIDDMTYDIPPPSPHPPMPSYINVTRGDTEKDHPPSFPHASSLQTLNENSEVKVDSVYMDMTATHFTESNKSERYKKLNPSHRMQSESTEGPDSDYEYLDESDDDDIAFDVDSLHSNSSFTREYTMPLTVYSQEQNVQLPSTTSQVRQSGFFKRFKLKMQNKKGKKKDRKMSLPDQGDLKAFQKELARRGSAHPTQYHHQRESTSSTSSGESTVGKNRERSMSVQPIHEEPRRTKKKHFLQQNVRKSLRINKAISDQLNPLPLPERSNRPQTNLQF